MEMFAILRAASGRGARGGYFRGAMRGGPPRASMKLDNRPKKLLVKGASAESLQAVRDWYEVRTVADWRPYVMHWMLLVCMRGASVRICYAICKIFTLLLEY